MKTTRKTTTKKKPAKKGVNPNARLFNPHEPINLDEAWARAQTEDPEKTRITVADLRRTFESVKAACESKPAKKPAARPIPPPPPMIRLRLPSEKPIEQDANEEGNIFTIFSWDGGEKDAIKWPWDKPFDGDELAWFSIPDGILPREPTQEERWRKEFEAKFTDCNLWKQPDGKYAYPITKAAWRGFLAAKKGGAE